jgi:hypothetical protein
MTIEVQGIVFNLLVPTACFLLTFEQLERLRDGKSLTKSTPKTDKACAVSWIQINKLVSILNR